MRKLASTSSRVDELWITEGIFDAIALLHNDVSAVSMMSSSPCPIDSLKALAKLRHDADKRLPVLVWALDNEPVAKANMRRWAKEARDLGFTCKAAVIPQPNGKKVDWNDLHLRWKPIEGEDKRAERIEQDLDEARHHGDLLLADSAEEKGFLIYLRDERKEFNFSFRKRLYWFRLDLDKYDRAMGDLESSDRHEDQLLNDEQTRYKALRQSGSVSSIANCNFQALYYMRNDLTDERDNKTIRKHKLHFVFLNTKSGLPHVSDFVVRDRFFKAHLKAAGVRYRGPGQCRHTYASQLLTTGVASVDWIAEQMGHTSANMIRQHYGMWINEDGPDVIGMLQNALNL